MLYFQCQRCKQWSGGDWSQCAGYCPVIQSPHFSKEAEVFYGPLKTFTEQEYKHYQDNAWRNE